MPELPEVETMMQALAKGIGKTHIINVSVRNNRLRQKIPDDFADTVGQQNILLSTLITV